MKKSILFYLLLILLTNVQAQAPQAFNYQAIARNSSGEILSSENITVRIVLLQDDMNVWQEDHTVETNQFGLFTMKIGGEDAFNASGSALSFSNIDWGEGIYEMNLQVDMGSGFSDLGSTELLSVPYALYSLNGQVGPEGPRGLQGEAGPQGPSGPQGIQGIQGPKGDAGTGLLNQGDWVSESVYSPGDYVFARSTEEAGINSMWILDFEDSYTSSIQPYLDPSHWVEFHAPSGPEGPQGPQGIQGLQGIPGDPASDDQTLSLTGTNLGISGGNTVDLSVLQDGVTDADADATNELNTQFYLSGSTLYLRDAGGLKSANLSSIGGSYESPWKVNELGVYMADPKWNLGIGTDQPTAKFTIQGSEDIPDEFPLFEIMNYRKEVVFSGYNNGVFVNIETSPKKGLKGGFAVGGYNRAKAEEIQEFFRVTNDSIRIYVNDELQGKGLKGGFAVGGYNRAKADKETPHFYVERGVTRINGNLELFGDIVNLSDQRLKQNIVRIEDALDLIKDLDGVYFDWNEMALDKFAIEDRKQIGMLAQDMEEVFPELVKTNADGYKMVDYSKLTPVLLEAIKQQQQQIEVLQEENKKLNELERRIAELENNK